MEISERFTKQINFILEIDRLKHVFRKTLLLKSMRAENDAEHSWHLAVMALLLSEYSNDQNLDVCKVIKMVLIHDIIEIDSGDTYCYDVEGVKEQAAKEKKAAKRLFGMLPPDQEKEFWSLWEEFDAMTTPEAQFAAALDRLQPLLHNFHTQGSMWIKHEIKRAQVVERNKPMVKGSKTLWKFSEKNIINEAVRRGYLAPDDTV